MNPYIDSQMEILRRIAQRGRNYALENLDSRYVDIFQHMLDEIARTHKALNENQ